MKKRSKKEIVEELSFKIVKGKLSVDEAMVELEEKFGEVEGFDVYCNNKSKFIKANEMFKRNYENEMKDNGRQLITVYIDGLSGTGKTYLGRNLLRFENHVAGKEQIDYYSPPVEVKGGVWRHIFHSYDLEYSTFLDGDLFSRKFDAYSFIEVFDKRRPYPYKYNKKMKLWCSNLVVVTTCVPLNTEIDRLVKKTNFLTGDDPNEYKIKIEESIPINITLTDDSIVVKRYNLISNEYEVEFTIDESILNEGVLETTIGRVHKLISYERELEHKNDYSLNIDDII